MQRHGTPPDERVYKLVVLGDAGVGKTSVCQRVANNCFRPLEEPTIGASFVTHVVGDAKLQIWDTAGQERYRALTQMYFRGAHACLLMFDVTRKESFDALDGWIRNVETARNRPVLILIANKIDQARVVTPQEGMAYATRIGATYFETSAATGASVDDCFDRTVELLETRGHGAATTLTVAPAIDIRRKSQDGKDKCCIIA